MKTPFTGRLDDMHWREEEENCNCQIFLDEAERYGFLAGMYWPNKTLAPWHMQAEINGEIVNFWPHTGKTHVEFGPKITDGFSIVFHKLAHQAKNDDNFSLIEDYQ